MAEKPRTLMVCSCEQTMPLDLSAIRKGCAGADVRSADHLCRAEVARFEQALAEGAPLTIACTQESPLFSQIAEEAVNAQGKDGRNDIAFVNIRENAGWSTDAAKAGPKMAALLAAGTQPVPQVPLVPLSSEGVVLIYGRDEKAAELAELLKGQLDVTVMVTQAENLTPRRRTEYPVVRGRIRNAKGYLGKFEITVDQFAAPLPSSRDHLTFGAPRDGAVSKCDILIDVSGGTPLFPAADLREGYLRADPNDPAALLQLALKARDLVGAFDKPRYIIFDADICAHSRSRIVGCHRCLDLCPTGAIAPAGNHVAIDPHICAGCGQCAAVCPTGAASYAMPPADALLRKMRAMLSAYRAAGGAQAVLLVHDDHGGAQIEALARHGDGLPAHVIPFSVNEVTQVGIEAIAAAFAYGAAGLRFLLPAKPRHDVTGLRNTIALAQPILNGLGLSGERVGTIETDDPDALGAATRELDLQPSVANPATFQPIGTKRDVQRMALLELHRAAPAPIDVIALPKGAPFGRVEVNVEGCTLCLACVSACPTGAMSDDPERPLLRFTEDACVQCGLCAATCPEKVITLVPQLDFRAATATARTVKEEEPFHCVRCAKPFGVKSTIERVTAKLEGKHWMFKESAKRLELLKMCDDCRVIAATEESFDPYGAPARPNPRTTEDYLREREKNEPS